MNIRSRSILYVPPEYVGRCILNGMWGMLENAGTMICVVNWAVRRGIKGTCYWQMGQIGTTPLPSHKMIQLGTPLLQKTYNYLPFFGRTLPGLVIRQLITKVQAQCLLSRNTYFPAPGRSTRLPVLPIYKIHSVSLNRIT
jgi:hypothetical protein